jgi:hypothetical protein
VLELRNLDVRHYGLELLVEPEVLNQLRPPPGFEVVVRDAGRNLPATQTAATVRHIGAK